MDVRLSSEQKALRDSVAKVARDLGPQTVAALDDDERTAKLDATVEAAGWRELRAGDADRPLASGVETAIVAEELSRGLADVAFVGPTLAAELRRRAGAPPAAGRETVGLPADLAALAIDPEVAQGRAVAVDAAGATSALLVVAAPAAQICTAGMAAEQGVRVDLTRTTEPPDLGGAVPLRDAARALDADDLRAATALGLALTCAELVGTMRGAVELATGYAKDRRQYGAPIGSFQAVQHLLADAHVATEGTRSAALHAAWAVDALEPSEALAAAALAKAYASRAARMVCEASIQVHGGIGNTWECLAHVHLRRALLSIDLLGGIGPNLDRVLAHQGIGVAAGGGGRGLR
jgi:alkylation response protein AidB-like acyl-CoA dehydrogenase